MSMRWLGAVLLALAGCQGTESNNIKPNLPEEYVLPPSDDSRFSSPPAYPKETLNNGSIKKDSGRPGADQMRGPGRFGAGPGMGGY
jgi:hypothetical protein